MKTFRITYLLILLCIGFVFSSCSSDDESELPTDTRIHGTWKIIQYKGSNGNWISYGDEWIVTFDSMGKFNTTDFSSNCGPIGGIGTYKFIKNDIIEAKTSCEIQFFKLYNIINDNTIEFDIAYENQNDFEGEPTLRMTKVL